MILLVVTWQLSPADTARLTGRILPFGGQSTFGCAATFCIVGGSQSRTAILKLHVSTGRPDKSDAVQITVVVPTGKKEPEGGLQVMINPAQLEEAGVANCTTAPHCPEALQTLIFVEQVIMHGGVTVGTETIAAL
jgi:hypothetical protein